MSEMNKTVGARIRQLRESKMISLEDFAERSSLSIEEIQLIENDNQLPSLAPLIKMARALGVRLGTFLDDNDYLGPVLCKREDQTRDGINFSNSHASSHNDLTYFPLAEKKAGRSMEPFVIDVASSSASKSDYQLTTHEGEEFIYVLQGSIELIYGKKTYIVNEGESIYYDSIVDHNLHAADEKGARILAVVYTPF